MAKKKYTLTKKDICDLYGITMSKLEYHITKTTTKRSPHVFPKGVLINGTKHYNKREIDVYAKAAWAKSDAQKPLKLVKPITRAELVKELEPGLNALFGVAAQEQEQKEADDALVRAFNKRVTELDEQLRQNKKTIMVMGGIIIALLVGYVAVL